MRSETYSNGSKGLLETFLQIATDKKKLLTALTVLTLIFSIAGFSAVSLISLHLHFLPDGRVVAHSHSHSDTGNRTGGDHDHTQQEYTVIGAVAHFLSKFTLATITASVLFYTVWEIVNPDIDFYRSDAFVWDIAGRSPPSFPRFR